METEGGRPPPGGPSSSLSSPPNAAESQLGLEGQGHLAPAANETSSSLFSEQDLQHSLQAHKDYREQKLAQCLTSLSALQLSRPEDPLVSHNLMVVKYANGELPLDQLLRALEALYGQVMASTGGGSDAAEEAEQHHPALLYNLALAYYLKKTNLGKSEHLLRKVRICTKGDLIFLLP